MSGLDRVTLGDVCHKPTYGAIASGSESPVGPLFVRQTDLRGGSIDWSSVPHCDIEAADVPKYAIESGDLLISRLGSVGRSARVRDTRGAVYAGYLVRFRVKRAVADAIYVGYQLQTPEWWAHVDAVRSGAVQPTLNAKQMAAFEFTLPPLSDQRAIAEVLGAFDDKIAANTKTVRLLLDLADAQFLQAAQEAKIGHESFADVAEIGGGGTPRTGTETYWGGDIAWATPTDVTALAAPYLTKTSRTITSEGLTACSSALYPAGSILMTSRATIGAFAVAQVPTAVNQGFIVANAKDPRNQWWLFHEMKSRVAEFVSFANGATFLELPRGRFKELKVRLASEESMTRFRDRVSPLHSVAAALFTESEKLAATRDELLPLLMSGKVQIKDAEKAVEGARHVW